MTDSSIRFLEIEFANTISSLTNLTEEIKLARFELSSKLNFEDEDINVSAIVDKCNEYNKMINTTNAIIEVLNRIRPEELRLIYKKIVELSAYVEIEYPAYKRDMLYVKEIYFNFNEFKDKLIERKYTFTLEDLFNDELERLDAINSISADIVLNKKLLKKDFDSDLEYGDTIVDRIEKIKDLEFILRYLANIPSND